MSAAAARRRKQLLARKKEAEATNLDPVSARLQQLLEGPDLKEEATAYEALQLAQSQVRKKVSAGEFPAAVDLAYESAFKILSNGRVSVASQLLTLLATVLRETHTQESDSILQHCQDLHKAFCTAMEGNTGEEATRLHRLHRDWLRRLVQWSSELGPVRFGHTTLQELLAQQSWALTKIITPSSDASLLEEEDELMELKTDAVTHMALAEQPDQILAFLKELPAPTAAQTKAGHVCPPADRDALLTRAVLCFVAVENLRDASKLVRAFIEQVEDRAIDGLTKSYTSKDDGKAPSHVIFCSMLIRICEKDPRTGPLFSWLLRSFKKELDGLYKLQIIQGYTTKIGKVYFNIQPPPSMLNMLENMMGMMGPGAGGPAGMNPAMMQAMLANMK